MITYRSVKNLPNGNVEGRFIIVTDLDHQSIKPNKKEWQSFLYEGTFTYNKKKKVIGIFWNNLSITLESPISSGNRGMELSDLAWFDANILSVDDRTGLVYKIRDYKDMIPWVFLNDGPGDTTKSFKAEWMTMKDELLHIGGIGKEWTTPDGKFINTNPMFIKVVTRFGQVMHVNWTTEYITLRKAAGIKYPGYLIFESCMFSHIHRKWFFLPRRASKTIYSEKEDEHKGTNLLLIADENFKNVQVKKLEPLEDKTIGYSAFQFVPQSDDYVIIALQSQEKDGVAVASYISAFNWKTGDILMKTEMIPGPGYKFEGILIM